MRHRKTVFDDGFHAHLTEGADLVGEPGIPMLMDLKNTRIPKGMIPFGKANTCKNRRQYVHFYSHDHEFRRVLTATDRYLDLLKQYDGVITPDCSILIGENAPALASTYGVKNGFFGTRGLSSNNHVRKSVHS